MNKKTSVIGIIVLVVIFGLGWFSLMKQSTVSPITNETATTTPAKITIDYKKLEKNKIYTSEEGDYKNLSKDEQDLLKQATSITKCANENNSGPCVNNPLQIENFLENGVKIVSLYNDILLLIIPSQKAPVYSYVLYNLKEATMLKGSIVSYGSGISDNNIIIFQDGSENMVYYKPGNIKFEKFNSAPLSSNETYSSTSWGGLKGSIVNNKLIISVFVQELNKTDYKKVREVSFLLPPVPVISQNINTLEGIHNAIKNINYTKYEKPFLFNEQEGQYKDLTSDEKLLVQSVFTEEELKSLKDLNYLELCEIVLFKEGVILVSFPTVKASFFYKLYDIKNNKLISDLHYSHRIRNTNILVLVNSDTISYVKPGMQNLAIVDGSKLQTPQTYVKYDGAGQDIEVAFTTEDIIKASIFDSKQGLSDGSNKKVREVSFNLP